MAGSINKLRKKLDELDNKDCEKKRYIIPILWNGKNPSGERRLLKVRPYEYFLGKLDEIESISQSVKMDKNRNWSERAVVYNMFVRYTTAFDHNGDGVISLKPNRFGLRETGTFLKAIAMLPYIKSLGANTLYLLPITAIGKDGRKGTLGSPYAIRHHYKLDERLTEPILEMTPEEQLSALVDSAHAIGLRVVLEFVFRTSSIDSDLAIEHPDWFYWIRANIKDRPPGFDFETLYGPPVFTAEELENIKSKVEKGNLKDLPKPHRIYRRMFTDVPAKTGLSGDKIRGNTHEVVSRIPSAFADWPPDDLQPPWSDVTYLRLFDHPDFNYIAYNTVRMYDDKLAKKQNAVEPLWKYISDIVPYYRDTFGIDGVMVDMGHALPKELLAEIFEKARKGNTDFAFWEENFHLTKASKLSGYNASLGYLPFDQHIPEKINSLIDMLSGDGSPIPFFLTPETHNTHRAAERPGGLAFSRFAWAMNCFLPGLLFIHSGFELGERQPVNTGLLFSEEEIKSYPAEKLPLFSEAALDWLNPDEFTVFMKEMITIRQKYIKAISGNSPSTFIKLKSSNKNIVSFMRRYGKQNIAFIGNMHIDKEIYFWADFPVGFSSFYDIRKKTGNNIVNDGLMLNLGPLEFIVAEIE